MIFLDHLAVAASNLRTGVDWVQTQLGVELQSGGTHERFGTHNKLLGLADGLYLEVIAKNPDAMPATCPTWFDLDNFSGPPRLANWICRSDDIDDAPNFAGPPVDMERGDLRWQITVPDDGHLPYGGAFPTLIKWAEGTRHPMTRLCDNGCRLLDWEITHPQADAIARIVEMDDQRVRFVVGASPGFRATFQTPSGERILA